MEEWRKQSPVGLAQLTLKLVLQPPYSPTPILLGAGDTLYPHEQLPVHTDSTKSSSWENADIRWEYAEILSKLSPLQSAWLHDLNQGALGNMLNGGPGQKCFLQEVSHAQLCSLLSI